MRCAALAVFAVATLAGCKDKQPAKAAAPTATATKSSTPGARPELARPVVTGSGLVPVKKLSATVSFSARELEVDGEQVGRFSDGMPGPQILGAMTRKLEERVRSDDPIGVSIDATLPYVRMTELVSALRQGGFNNLALLTSTGTQMVPITLDERAEGEGVRPVITFQANRIALWSMSGMEGTLEQPKMVMQWPQGGSLEQLTKALVEICERRWPDRKRAAEDRVIVVQIDRLAPTERVLQLLASIRSEGTLELFPSIFLTAGI